MNQIPSAKNVWARNKNRIIITAAVVATTAAVIMKQGLNQHDAFLKEHDLYNEFYQPEED